jgi:hypothetical protein
MRISDFRWLALALGLHACDTAPSHVYSDRQGNYYGSDTRIEAGAVDWQELRRVSLSED